MKITVIMGAYNCADTLSQALESIFAQTYKDWDIVICDDGSSDGTKELARKYSEKYPDKIKLLENTENIGLNRTLNKCLHYVTGEYIARMDADDISLPERLEKEVSFLDSHPEYAIVSSPMIYFDENGDWGHGAMQERPIAIDFINGTPFCHAPSMYRTEAMKKVGGYSTDKRTIRAEDYDLWFRMYANGFIGYNLQQPYYKMRDDNNAYHRRKFKYCLNEAYVRFKGFKMLKLPVTVYPKVLRPIIVGLLPKKLYLKLHHAKKRG